MALTQKHNILIVEDDENLGYLILENFLHEGYQAKLARSGEEAMQLFATIDFNLVILDLILPDISGFEIAKNIRKSRSVVPFLFLTAIHSDERKFEGYELGAEDFINKPFSFRELDYKVKAILRRSNGEEKAPVTTELKFQNITLNPITRNLEIDNRRFKLTQRESDILKILLHYAGEHVEREEVLSQLWGRADEYTSNSLDVYISRLRKILGETDQVELETIYASGFRLTQPEA